MPSKTLARVWKSGTDGEQEIGAVLDGCPSVVALRMDSIDHLVVAPTGVFLVEATGHQGQVEYRDAALFRTDERLYVGGRDRTSLVESMLEQVAAVREVLARQELAAMPVAGILCFTGADWPALFKRPLTIRGVTALWPDALAQRLEAPGRLSPAQVVDVAGRLAVALRPA